MTDYVLPASPSWYCSRVTDANEYGLLVFGAKNSIFIWDVNVKPPRHKGYFRAHQERVVGVSLCRHQLSQPKCCSAGEDGKIKIWNLDSQALLAEHSEHKNSPTVVDWSRVDQDLVVSGDDKGGIVAWRPSTGRCQHHQLDAAHVFCLACSPHSACHVAVGYKTGIVLVVDISGQRSDVLQRLRGHDEEVHSVSWCPATGSDSTNWRSHTTEMSAPSSEDDPTKEWLLASGSRDRTIRVWNVRQGNAVHTLRLPSNTGGHKRERFDEQGRTARVWVALYWPQNRPHELVSSSHNGELLLWDLHRNGKQKWTVFSPGATTRGHTRIVFNICCGGTDLNTLCTISMDRQICFWDVDRLEGTYTIPTLGGFVHCLALSPLNPGHLAIGVGDNIIRVWNLSNQSNRYDIQSFWQGIRSKVTAMVWHPSREGMLAYGTDDGRVGIYNVLSSKPPQISGTYHKKIVYVVKWGPPCATASETGESSSFCVYSCGDGIVLQHGPMHQFHQPATDINQLIRKTNNIQHKFPIRSEISWKPDFSLVAIGNDDGTVELLGTPDLRRLCVIHVHRKLINCISWHPQFTGDSTEPSDAQHWLATGSNESVIHIVDVSTVLKSCSSSDQSGPAILTESFCQLSGHAGRVTGLAWSIHADGQLVSTSYDGTAQVWSVTSTGGQPVANYRGHSGRLLCVQWSLADHDCIFTGADDNTLQAWPVTGQPHLTPPTGVEKRRTKNKQKKKAPKTTAAEAEQQPASPLDVSTCNGDSRVTSVAVAASDDVSDLQRLLEKKKLELQLRLSQLTSAAAAAADGGPDIRTTEDPAQSTTRAEEPGTRRTIADVLSARLLPADPVSAAPVSDDRDHEVSAEVGKTSDQTETGFMKKDGRKDKRKRKTKSLLPVSGTMDNRGKAQQQADCETLATVTFSDEQTLSEDLSHLGCFVDRRGTYSLLNTEGTYHLDHGNMEQYTVLELFKGSPASALRTAADKGQLNDWLMGLAPMACPQHWKQLCGQYARQLEEEGLYQKAVSYHLAVHQVYDAVNMLRRNSLYKEAYCLAKVRLAPTDPVLTAVCSDWASQLTKEGNYEMAAKCHLAMRQPVEAAKLLSRRTDLSALKTATHVTLAANEIGDARVHGHKYIQQCLLKCDWASAFDLVQLHGCFKMYGLVGSVHEVMVTQLVKLALLDKEVTHQAVHSVVTQSELTSAKNKASVTALPAFILDPAADDPLSPWQPHMIDRKAFVLHMVYVWHELGVVSFEVSELQSLYSQLCDLRLTRQNQTATLQVLLEVSIDITTGLVALLLGATEGAAHYWTTALATCCGAQQDNIAQGLCRLLLPQGPAHLSSLQQQVSALTLTIRAGQNDTTTSMHQLDTGGMPALDIPGAGGSFHQTATNGSRDLEDSHDTAVSNSSLECSWQDCLAAYHYLTVIKSLRHNKRHGDSAVTVSDDLTHHSTSDNGDTSIGVGSVDKPSTDNVPVASSVDVNVSGEAGCPRNSGDVYSETGSEVAEKSTVDDPDPCTGSTGIAPQNDPAVTTADTTSSVVSGIGQAHQMTAGALHQITRYLLWDVHADRCQLTALLQYVRKAVNGQTGKHTDLKLTTAVPVEKERSVDDATAVSSGRLSRVLSGEYIPMTGRTDKQRRPHELILMSPIKSYVRSPFLPSPATPGDIIEEFEEMSSETDVCSSQCAVTNVSDTHVTDANVTDTNVTDTNVTDVSIADVNVTDAMLTSAIEQTRIYKQVKSIFSDEPLEEEDGELAKSLGDLTDVTDLHTDVSNVSQINVTSLSKDCETIDEGNFEATATRTTVGEGDNDGVDGESVIDVSFCVSEHDTTEDRPTAGPQVQERRDQIARKTEDSPATCFANVPDEWYSLPPEVRYMQPYLTSSQLVQERRRITRLLQQLPSSVKTVLFPDPVTSARLLLQVTADRQGDSQTDRQGDGQTDRQGDGQMDNAQLMSAVATWGSRHAISAKDKAYFDDHLVCGSESEHS